RQEGAAPPGRHVLAARVEADRTGQEDQGRPDGPRVRPGDLDDAPAGAPAGGGLQEDQTRRLRRIVRSRRPRLDHEGAQSRGPRGRSPRGHGREGREAVQGVLRRRGQVPGAGHLLGWQLLERMTDAAPPSRSKSWRWGVCILLLLATTINYMDRVTLANTAKRVKTEFNLTNEQYGSIEEGFSYAFAGGSLLFGILADRIN